MLGIRVDNGALEFDYRMGKEWNEKKVEAVFEFLSLIKDQAPSAEIFRTDEGCYERPSKNFTSAFDEYYKERRMS